jgi:hypothetical protein
MRAASQIAPGRRKAARQGLTPCTWVCDHAGTYNAGTGMDGNNGYAVFFFPQALEALGEAIKPYLRDGPAGPHVVCHGIDTGGALIEMTLSGSTTDGKEVELELMVPSGMVRMIVSAHSDEMFGFGPHALKGAVQKVPPVAEEAKTDGGAAGGDAKADTAPAQAPQSKERPAAVEKAAESGK